jgi:putative ABC transport system substrate-binding protein
MNRRDTALTLTALGAMPQAILAQTGSRMPVIGLLHPGSAGTVSGSSSAVEVLLSGLSGLGYVDGKSIRIEYRWGQGRPERLLELARELVRLKVELIVAIAPSAVKAAAAATRELPIVAHDLETDPVAAGLVASLARPGGNLTGLFLNHADLAAKWLQQITEVKPGARQLAILSDASTGPYQLDAIKGAARAMAVQFAVLEFKGSDGILSVLDAGLKARPDE